MPKTHPLAKKKRLEITDLYHERLLCVSDGDCLNIDDFRKDVQTLYPQIILEDAGYFYDLDTFNRCEEQGCLLLTLDVWDHIHPFFNYITCFLALSNALWFALSKESF